MPRCSLTDISTSEDISQPFRKPTWTQVSHSVKIAGSEVMWHSHAESKDQNVSNATVLTNLKTIGKFGWCCKVNNKINLPRLETKKGEPCPHSFKCSNCQGDHQADSNQCPFWRHRFNRKWQQRKYAEIRENRSKSIRSEGNGVAHQWLWKISKFSCKMFARTYSLLTSSLKL